MKIQSSKNNRVKQWKKLLTKKEREKTRTYLIEGFHLVGEAIKNHAEIKELVIRENIEREISHNISPEKVFFVTEEIANAISATETTQGIFAVIAMPDRSEDRMYRKPYLLLDNVQDPGNVGTMIRTANAAGFEAVVLSEGCAEVYNDKTLRSAQGSHFHLKIFRNDLKKEIIKMKEKNIPVYGTALDPKAKSYRTISSPNVFGLIMGNEGQGMQDELLNSTTENLYIPIRGEAESLNVAVAAGILMFSLSNESLRDKRLHD